MCIGPFLPWPAPFIQGQPLEAQPAPNCPRAVGRNKRSALRRSVSTFAEGVHCRDVVGAIRRPQGEREFWQG
jgi:hypothetical protein